VSLVAAVALLVCIPALAILQLPGGGDRRDHARLAGGVVAAALVWIGASSVIPGVAESALRWPVGALAGVAGLLWSSAVLALGPPALASSGARAFYGCLVLWTALVFVPAATFVFYPETLGFTISSSVWDLGGAVPVHVACGVAFLALLRVRDRRVRRESAHDLVPTEGGTLPVGSGRPGLVVAAVTVLWACWITALLGLDMAIDSATPPIIRNGLLIPIASMAGWTLIERVRLRRTSLHGLSAALIAGLVAVTPVGGALGWPWALALGFLVGVLCSALDRGTFGRRMVSTHFVAAVVGLIWVGLFGDGGGFVYTGQFSTVHVQLAVTLLVAGWGYLAAVLLSPMLGHRHPPRLHNSASR
jgi:Amt family ammonium transporter